MPAESDRLLPLVNLLTRAVSAACWPAFEVKWSLEELIGERLFVERQQHHQVSQQVPGVRLEGVGVHRVRCRHSLVDGRLLWVLGHPLLPELPVGRQM